jgi:hypothetical protein
VICQCATSLLVTTKAGRVAFDDDANILDDNMTLTNVEGNLRSLLVLVESKNIFEESVRVGGFATTLVAKSLRGAIPTATDCKHPLHTSSCSSPEWSDGLRTRPSMIRTGSRHRISRRSSAFSVNATWPLCIAVFPFPLYIKLTKQINHEIMIDNTRELVTTTPIPVPDRSQFDSDVSYKQCVEGVLEEYRDQLELSKTRQLGYPIYHAKDNVEELDLGPLAQFQNYYINNAGDPFSHTAFGSHSHGFEVGVLEWFADLWELKNPFWGYVSSGGSESNLEALFIARENFPEALTFVSAEAHFSVFKSLRILRMPYVVIECDRFTGEMLYDDFETKLQNASSMTKQAIVALTIGTTMKGAIDRPNRVSDVLQRCNITEFYIHVDAALSGIFVPLLDRHLLSFDQHPISSCCCSGHKFLGVPLPCGVFVVRKQFVENIGSNVEYINSSDLPLSCSRNGLASLYLWLMLSELGRNRIKHDALRCIKYAQYVKKKLSESGIDCWLNPMSVTVCIRKDCIEESFCAAWQLASSGTIVHVVIMPHTSKLTLVKFCESLIKHSKDRDIYGKAMARLGQAQLSDSCVPVFMSGGTGNSNTL